MTKKISDKDIRLLVRGVDLTTDHLADLFDLLGLSHAEVQRAKDGADARDTALQNAAVMRHWRQTNGAAATRQVLIDNLKGNGYADAAQQLTEKLE